MRYASFRLLDLQVQQEGAAATLMTMRSWRASTPSSTTLLKVCSPSNYQTKRIQPPPRLQELHRLLALPKLSRKCSFVQAGGIGQSKDANDAW